MTLDLFAALQKREEAIEAADASVTTAPHGDVLVARVTDALIQQCRAAGSALFTADDVGLLLDVAGVAKDQATRRRIVGTIVNRGKGKLWVQEGYTSSRDPRRNARPVTLWRIILDAGASGV
jgi:hypothetical protein